MNPESSTADFDPRGFSGQVRVFPLPAVSLFPGVVLPLHIYEPRYRALMESALEGDQLIAMATLKAGWQSDYLGRPPLEPTACLGKITGHHRLEDGKYNLLLAGVARIQLGQEITPPEAYRRYEAEILSEQSELSSSEEEPIRNKLAQLFRDSLPSGQVPEQLQKLFDFETPLNLLADIAAYSLPIKHEEKLSALSETDLKKRTHRLISAIEAIVPKEDKSDPKGYPPSFSDN